MQMSSQVKKGWKSMIQLTLISISIPAILPMRNETGVAILLFMKVDVAVSGAELGMELSANASGYEAIMRI